jgi:hypothetical protein
VSDDRTAELRRVFGVRNVSGGPPFAGDYVHHITEQARLRVLRVDECCQGDLMCNSLFTLGDDGMCRQVCGAFVELIDNV